MKRKGQPLVNMAGGPVHDSEPLVLACIKTRYTSQAAAKLHPAHKGLRAYRCGLCGGWHVTHHRTARTRRRDA